MELHAKQLQSMNSAVVGLLWPPRNAYMRSLVVISKKNISKALLY